MDWQISSIDGRGFAWGLSEDGPDHLAKLVAALRRVAGEHAPVLKKPELRLLDALGEKGVHWQIRRTRGAIRWGFEPWSRNPRIEGGAPSLSQALAQMAEAASRCYGIDCNGEAAPRRLSDSA